MTRKILMFFAVGIAAVIINGSQCSLFSGVPIGGEGEGEGGGLIQIVSGVELLSLRQVKTDSAFQVFGRLFNTNAMEVSYAQIRVRFLDADDNAVDTRLVTVQKIPAGRLSGFSALSFNRSVEKAEADILIVLF